MCYNQVTRKEVSFLNRRVKEIRIALGLSQDAFGAKLGLKRAAVSRIESGAVNLTETNVILICEKFNVSREWLLNGAGEMFLPESSGAVDVGAGHGRKLLQAVQGPAAGVLGCDAKNCWFFCAIRKRRGLSAWFRGSGCRGRLRKELWYCIRHPRCRSYEYARRHRVK